MGERMLSAQLKAAMNQVEEALADLRNLDTSNILNVQPKIEAHLEDALKRLNEIAAFYKIQ